MNRKRPLGPLPPGIPNFSGPEVFSGALGSARRRPFNTRRHPRQSRPSPSRERLGRSSGYTNSEESESAR